MTSSKSLPTASNPNTRTSAVPKKSSSPSRLKKIWRGAISPSTPLPMDHALLPPPLLASLKLRRSGSKGREGRGLDFKPKPPQSPLILPPPPPPRPGAPPPHGGGGWGEKRGVSI